MTTTHRTMSCHSRAVARLRTTGTLLGMFALAGCNGALDVVLPGKVNEAALGSPALAATMVASTQGDFECAFSEFVHSTGLWSNELLNSSGGGEVNGWGARTVPFERDITPCPSVSVSRGGFSVYLPLQIARNQADSAVKRLDGFTDAQVANRGLLTATALGYAGFSYTLLGEAYCSMALDAGPLVTRAQVLAIAEQRFTRAIDLATTANNTPILNMARLGRARVRLDLGNKTGAAADAKLIPAGFVYNATYASTVFRRNNTVVLNNNVNFHESVAPAYRNLTVGAVADSRVPVRDEKRNGQDALTPLWTQQKYTTTATSIPMATWDEAQLIIAEAEGGQSAIDAINRIRTKYNLPAYAPLPTATAQEIQNQVIEERRRTLFLDGHSIGDHLRYNLPFLTGLNQKGVRYGDNTCLVLPDAELNGR